MAIPFLLNLDKGLSVAYNDSQAKLATKKGYAMNGCATIRLYKPTKDDSRLRRYEIGFRPSSFVLRFSFFSACAHEDVGANLRLHFYQLS